jgi:hypothetical protein
MKKIIFALFLFTALKTSSYATKIKASALGFDPTDATSILNKAISAQVDTLIIDDTGKDWITGQQLINGKSNYTIILEPKVNIVARKGLGVNEKIFNFINCKNIKLLGYGASIRLLKSEYGDGQFRHCVQTSGIDGFEMRGLICKESGGDGIHIAPDNSHLIPSRNVIIKDCIFDNNNRQGISITCAENVLIEHCVMKNTKGTAPSAGIDIEPYRPTHIVKDISIKNCKIIDNYGYGIMIPMGESQTKNNSVKVENVLIENCQRGGIHFSDGYYGLEQGNGQKDLALTDGIYFFDRVMVKNCEGPALFCTKPAELSIMTFKDCIFENNNNRKEAFKFFDKTENYAYLGNTNIRIGPIFLNSYLYPNIEIGNNELAKVVKYGGLKFENCILIDDEDRNFLFSYGAGISQGVSYNQPLTDVSGNFLYINKLNNNTALYNNIPSTMKNVNLSRNSLSIFPTEKVEIIIIDNEALKTDPKNLAELKVERSEINKNYPLPVFYEYSGTAAGGFDFNLLSEFVMLPSSASSQSIIITALPNDLKDNRETVIISLKNSDAFYSLTDKKTGTVYIGKNQTLGSESLSIKKFIAYPNPILENEIFIKCEAVSTIEEMKVYDVNGKIMAFDYSKIDGERIKLNFKSGLNQGIYFLRINHKDSFSLMKLVK